MSSTEDCNPQEYKLGSLFLNDKSSKTEYQEKEIITNGIAATNVCWRIRTTHNLS